MSEIFGFVSEPHRNGEHLVTHAINEDGVVTCHDISGFAGSWKMKDGGVFFETEIEAVYFAKSFNADLARRYYF
jgi:hypothetical protein